MCYIWIRTLNLEFILKRFKLNMSILIQDLNLISDLMIYDILLISIVKILNYLNTHRLGPYPGLGRGGTIVGGT